MPLDTTPTIRREVHAAGLVSAALGLRFSAIPNASVLPDPLPRDRSVVVVVMHRCRCWYVREAAAGHAAAYYDPTYGDMPLAAGSLEAVLGAVAGHLERVAHLAPMVEHDPAVRAALAAVAAEAAVDTRREAMAEAVEALRVANRAPGGAEARRAARAAAFRALNAARAALRRAEVALHGPRSRPVPARCPKQAPARRVPAEEIGKNGGLLPISEVSGAGGNHLAPGSNPIAQPAPTAG
ncbi:hypothetical protein M0638_26950 [Roseomonas sp. NAR14]|uniref:Uncharacterized protein n=1 Tax=Roseomonas acroporae TaxID=2937791 RepID=A0A9X1YC09_9PROT|nr:hypothetical protein [Roseomonas acroporae]MCK8787999.1 hypothetical protein [Roseomonas acroporae]